ncbi:hypothetical protein ACFO26_04185 [Lactococcus nasutitermitis]|uniref:DUF4190 domain-containing protein n=1 Tax=Lactococcus nasutitermitis TaxID=1652957 RepID=A0ABV9JFK6_9LACT|nr:hypothetical protein [Lactococcus nasutitermitis]
MGILLALIAGVASLGNYMYLSNTALQIVLTVLSIVSMAIYGGRRTRKSYAHDGTRIFTFGFAICFVAFIGSAAILLAYLLHLN